MGGLGLKKPIFLFLNKNHQPLAFSRKAKILASFALFEEDMNRTGIDDQTNDNIIDEPKEILEEDVEDDDDNNLIRSQILVFSEKVKILAFFK